MGIVARGAGPSPPAVSPHFSPFSLVVPLTTKNQQFNHFLTLVARVNRREDTEIRIKEWFEGEIVKCSSRQNSDSLLA